MSLKNKLVLMILWVGQVAFASGYEGQGGGAIINIDGRMELVDPRNLETNTPGRSGGGDPESIDMRVELLNILSTHFGEQACPMEDNTATLGLRLTAARSVLKAAKISEEIQFIVPVLGKLICNQPVALGIDACLGRNRVRSTEGQQIIYFTARSQDNKLLCVSENYNRHLGQSRDSELVAIDTYLALAIAIKSDPKNPEDVSMRSRNIISNLIRRGYR